MGLLVPTSQKVLKRCRHHTLCELRRHLRRIRASTAAGNDVIAAPTQRPPYGFVGYQLAHAQTPDVDGSRFRFERYQQLVGIGRRSQTRL